MNITNPLVRISQEDLYSGNYSQKLSTGAKHGLFYLEMPDDCKEMLKNNETFTFAKSWYNDEQLKRQDFGSQDGYSDFRMHGFQNEAMMLSESDWDNILSERFAATMLVAQKMKIIAIDILKKTLSHLDIKQENWRMATGDLLNQEGNQERGRVMFVSNYYSPIQENMKGGLGEHRDTGYITVLFINKAGLEGYVGDKEWVKVPPLKDHFVINFGRALQLFVNDKNKLIAVKHVVKKLDEERISFGVFLGPQDESPLYRLDSNNLTKIYDSASEYRELTMGKYNFSEKIEDYE